MNLRSILFGALCISLLGFLGWANAIGYVLFGEAAKRTASHSTALHHK